MKPKSILPGNNPLIMTLDDKLAATQRKLDALQNHSYQLDAYNLAGNWAVEQIYQGKQSLPYEMLIEEIEDFLTELRNTYELYMQEYLPTPGPLEINKFFLDNRESVRFSPNKMEDLRSVSINLDIHTAISANAKNKIDRARSSLFERIKLQLKGDSIKKLELEMINADKNRKMNADAAGNINRELQKDLLREIENLPNKVMAFRMNIANGKYDLILNQIDLYFAPRLYYLIDWYCRMDKNIDITYRCAKLDGNICEYNVSNVSELGVISNSQVEFYQLESLDHAREIHKVNGTLVLVRGIMYIYLGETSGFRKLDQKTLSFPKFCENFQKVVNERMNIVYDIRKGV